ncbi:MAG: hypothetical protein FWE34_00055 [Defluviitaleaceae bacterium]|nr:hypothetical protein [Defluviitaleaceae bacterium]
MTISVLTNWTHKSGTSERECDCGSWLNHYINFSRTEPLICSVEGCNKKAEHGMHMINSDSGVSGEKIIPGCISCHGKKNTAFILKKETKDVSANKLKTCNNNLYQEQLRNEMKIKMNKQ